MYFTVYKTTNTVNGRIYIGVHKTNDLEDGYLGSGVLLRRAIEKYGEQSFKKEYLAIFDNPEQMFEMETVLVNEEFVAKNTNYNLKVGGEGGAVNMKATEYYESGTHSENIATARVAARKKHQELKRHRMDEYYKNPKRCQQCNKPLDYESVTRKQKKFCNSSCSATYNNARRIVTEEHKKKVSETMKRKRTISV